MTMGSSAWAGCTNGQLRLRDYAHLMGQLGAQVPAVPGELASRVGWWLPLHSCHPPDPAPDTAVVREAKAQCLSAERDRTWIFSHSLRTFQFAQLFAQVETVRFDLEILWVAAMLHDISLACWDQVVRSGAPCFAVRGSREARELAMAHDWSPERVCALTDAISVHINPRVSRRKYPEGYLLSLASSLDVGGTRYRSVRSCAVKQILDENPRNGFGAEIESAWNAEARAAPCTRTRFLRLPLKLLIRTSPLEEARSLDC